MAKPGCSARIVNVAGGSDPCTGSRVKPYRAPGGAVWPLCARCGPALHESAGWEAVDIGEVRAKDGAHASHGGHAE